MDSEYAQCHRRNGWFDAPELPLCIIVELSLHRVAKVSVRRVSNSSNDSQGERDAYVARGA